MSLPSFTYHEPGSLEDVCRVWQDLDGKGALLAGGTDLLVKMRNRDLDPKTLVSLGRIPEIHQINSTRTGLVIGAGCTITEIAESEEVCRCFPALASAAEQLGSPSVRNMGTVGGNIVTASPAADLPPALMAYGARVRLKSADQERIVPLETLFSGPGKTILGSDEVLVDIHLDIPPEKSGAVFFKLGTRNALQISIINGACFLALDPDTGDIQTARMVVGAAAPTVMRMTKAEAVLKGQYPEKSLFQVAGQAATRQCSPIDDLRGSAVFRREMAGTLTFQTLETILDEIQKLSARRSV
jgi:carbon-monoxide dehydrogenase medium subunit